MTFLNPVHVSLVALAILSGFLCVFIARPGLGDYLSKLLFTYVLLIVTWAIAMLVATSGIQGVLFSLSAAATLIATFGIPPTALLVAFFIRSQVIPKRKIIVGAYLPALIFLFLSLTVPSGGYVPVITCYGVAPLMRTGSLPETLNVAVTLLYIPAAFIVFFITWISPRNRRAKKQSFLFLAASVFGMASTALMTLIDMPLQYIPSLYIYVIFLYIAMRRYRLALDAPNFAKDQLWDHVRDELLITNMKGLITFWNQKAAARFNLVPNADRDIRSLFRDDGSISRLFSDDNRTEGASFDRVPFRVAGDDPELVSLTGRCIRDAYGDTLGVIFLSQGSVPYQSLKSGFGITVKEWEVLGLLAGGKEYKEIGEVMYVSPFTVKNHIHSAYQKLGIKNRYELIPLLFP